MWWSIRSRVDRGVAALEAGDPDAAAQELSSCVEHGAPDDPLRARAAVHLAEALLVIYNQGGGTRDDAMALVTRMVELDGVVAAEVRDPLTFQVGQLLFNMYLRWHVIADLEVANGLLGSWSTGRPPRRRSGWPPSSTWR